MKAHFLASILLFCLLTLEDSRAAPLKKEKEKDQLKKTILKVGRDCKTSGFQPKEGSICLKLTVVAGVNVNFGVGYEEKDEKKNDGKESKSDKNEVGKQNQEQEKTLNKDQRQKQELEQQKKEQKKKLKELRKN